MLKNTLSLLLSKFYSKKESELVGHQAMPSTDNVALTPTTTSIDGWGAVCNGVAPTDGFACIKFTADTATCIASAQTPNPKRKCLYNSTSCRGHSFVRLSDSKRASLYVMRKRG